MQNSELKDGQIADLWYDGLLWRDTVAKIGIINHPKHGTYYIWNDGECFGITKDDQPPHCAYSSLAAMLKTKDL